MGDGEVEDKGGKRVCGYVEDDWLMSICDSFRKSSFRIWRIMGSNTFREYHLDMGY